MCKIKFKGESLETFLLYEVVMGAIFADLGVLLPLLLALVSQCYWIHLTQDSFLSFSSRFIFAGFTALVVKTAFLFFERDSSEYFENG